MQHPGLVTVEMYLTTLVTWKMRREEFCIWAAEDPWANENTDCVSGWFLNILGHVEFVLYMYVHFQFDELTISLNNILFKIIT